MHQPSLKRKRGPGHAVLEAAKRGGDPSRSKMIDHIHSQTPRTKLLANNHLHFRSQRSSSQHYRKMGKKPNLPHVHEMMARFNKQPRNAVKAHMKTFFPDY